ncbi:hypothetical protein AA313_de0208126 [Arthrobotrys entomopaga]|nr:hypothetical protein AA313_de0208126 [Arthrobotrys entomopaga]
MTQERFFEDVVEALKSNFDNPGALVQFQDINPESANALWEKLYPDFDDSKRLDLPRRRFNSHRELTLTIPTPFHVIGVPWITAESFEWIKQGLVPRSWGNDTIFMSSPGRRDFVDRYAGSIKEPYGLISLYRTIYPSLVIEIGWGEAWSRLEKYRNLWFEGSNGGVKTVILIHLYKDLEEDKVRGDLEFMSFNNGEPFEQRKTIWPIPTDEDDPFILLGDIYGDRLPAGCDPTTRLPLRMSWLRFIGLEELRAMSLTHA